MYRYCTVCLLIEYNVLVTELAIHCICLIPTVAIKLVECGVSVILSKLLILKF